jgi:hypothetical protein
MKVEGTIVDELTAKKQTEEALAELMKVDDTHNMNFHKVLVEKNGQMVEIEVPIDDINLLDDFDDEDLTEEGERSLGIISAEYDSTSEDGPEKKSRNRMPVVEINIKDKNDDFEIICPHTGSKNVYQINSFAWASYETDEPFMVRINIEED